MTPFHKESDPVGLSGLQMKKELTACLVGIAKNHPNTTGDNFIADFGVKYVPGYVCGGSVVDFLEQSSSRNRRLVR